MITVDYVSDWQARLRGRLAAQFQGLPNVQAVVDAIAEQVQELEDSGQALFGLVSIDDSQGVQLDLLGRAVGQKRGGVSDPMYRLYLRARIRANKSSGTPEELFAVLQAMFNGAAVLRYYPSTDTAFVLRVLAPGMSPPEAAVARELATVAAKLAGVRAILEWQPGPDDQTFATDGGDGLGFGDATDLDVGGRLAGSL